MASVRYIVDDVDAAIGFYCGRLGFAEVMHPAPPFAILQRGDLRLLLSAPNPQGGGGQAMPDGARPGAGRLEPLLAGGRGPRRAGGFAAGGGRALPQRDRRGRRRPADPGRGPGGQPRRAVRAAVKLPEEPDVVAPDGSAVRILERVSRGSMAHFELAAGATSLAVRHRTVEELWYFVSGRGEMWLLVAGRRGRSGPASASRSPRGPRSSSARWATSRCAPWARRCLPGRARTRRSWSKDRGNRIYTISIDITEIRT